MSRRDGYEGDWVEVSLDGYHDLRTAFSFSVSAAGVKSDQLISENGQGMDPAWNPIWYAQAHVHDQGWSAEMKIPFSQLRFSNELIQVWGLQIERRTLRKEERSVWQRIPQDASGWVSEFGELHGIRNIKPQAQLELQPFTVTAIETDPEGHQGSVMVGIDGKVGITNDLTMDFTINPDFGQVEADPAAIALDGFQLFFREQRPFFIENKNIFDYRFYTPIIGSVYSSDNLFYSRRIGRSPQGNQRISSAFLKDVPQQTTILGAAKLSGKTKKGLSIGIMESLTGNEYAHLSNQNSEEDLLVEPLTNYFVARLQKDYNNRNTFLGGMVTSVVRSTNESTHFLHQTAHTGGIDFKHQWKNRSWYFGANMVMSHITGSAAALLETQESIVHLFQRPGGAHINIDSSKTRMTGTGGDIKLGKAGEGHLQFETGVTWRSPELELNDIGFLREADLIQHYFGVTYRSTNAFGGFRKASIGYKHWLNWDFSGNLNYIDWDIELNGTWQNNWSGTVGFFSQPHIYSKSLLQGGPRLLLSDQYGFWWALNSDTRKKLYITYNGWTKMGDTGSYYLLENGISVHFQPINRFRFAFSPRFTMIRHRLQFNQHISWENQNRHIVSWLDQNTLSFAFRADLVINANMALQYYGEPFISSGAYHRLGYITQPLNDSQDGQIHYFDSNTTLPESELFYAIDENKDGQMDYKIQNPDFTFFQFRSNLVYRWEYRPGSELFLVWNQGIVNQSMVPGNIVGKLRRQLFSQNLNHTFLIKMTYRFHR